MIIEKNKGITMIVLIITIVIMLILVGVVVSVTLGEDGLIGTARKVVKSTNQYKAEEQVRLAQDKINRAIEAEDEEAIFEAFKELNPNINEDNLELYLYGVLPLIEGEYYCATDMDILKLERIEIVEGNASDWQITDQDGMKIITKYIGAAIASNQTLVVPNMINGERILGIEAPSYDMEDTPFYNANTVDGTIKISDGLMIGTLSFAFANMHNIEFPNVIVGGALGMGSFLGCTNLGILNINNGVKGIASNAFNECTGLETVIMSNNVKSIGDTVFDSCSNLQNVTLSKSIDSIGNRCFANCTSLQRIAIPKNVTNLEENAFYRCTSLQEVVLSDNIRIIKRMTFAGCTNLISITLPTRLTEIASYGFENCTSLQSIEIPSTIQTISSVAFNGNTNLTSIIIHKTQAEAPVGEPWGATNATITYDQ